MVTPFMPKQKSATLFIAHEQVTKKLSITFVSSEKKFPQCTINNNAFTGFYIKMNEFMQNEDGRKEREIYVILTLHFMAISGFCYVSVENVDKFDLHIFVVVSIYVYSHSFNFDCI